jgi:hypothetical protein
MMILYQHEIPHETALIRDSQTIWSPFGPYDQTETILWITTLAQITLQGDRQFSDMMPE